jgi:hypothetical protein
MKIKAILQSRKFWTLVASLVAIAASYFQSQITDWQAVQAVVAAGAAYSVGTAIEASAK